MIPCELCGQEISEPREAWRQATGWVNPKGAKGMTGMRQTGKLAHAICIVKLRHRAAPAQERIV